MRANRHGLSIIVQLHQDELGTLFVLVESLYSNPGRYSHIAPSDHSPHT
ncbi:MAG: hypothetical protein U0487_03185 [Patescibacteria group bacterium]